MGSVRRQCTSGPAVHVRAQTVLYNNTGADIERWVRGLAATLFHARFVGLITGAEIVIGDSSPRPSLTAGDVDRLQSLLPDWVERPDYRFYGANLMSAEGQNQAAVGCRDDSMILILNPDTYCTPNMLDELVRTLGDPSIGLAEPRQIPIEHPKAFDLEHGDTSWASGCAMLMSAQTFAAVDGFDSRYFPLYCDDVDLSWRLRLLGKRVVTVPRAVIVHDKRVNQTGHVIASDVELYHGLLARLMLATRYGNTDVITETIEHVDRGGLAPQRRALADFRTRVSNNDVPEPLDGAEEVAQFINGNYAVHRF